MAVPDQAHLLQQALHVRQAGALGVRGARAPRRGCQRGGARPALRSRQRLLRLRQRRHLYIERCALRHDLLQPEQALLSTPPLRHGMAREPPATWPL